MKLIVQGVNHKTAPLELREKISVRPELLKEMLKNLTPEGKEAALLSTCNRVEVYSIQEGLTNLLNKLPGAESLTESIYTYRHEDIEAVKHLFRVACGLDAMVVGETQIINQVKAAYRNAREAGCTGKLLNKLFEYALSTAKKVHSQTRISDRNSSVPAVCATLAYKIYGDLGKRTLVVIGAGETAEITLKVFKQRGVGRVIVINRSVEKAMDLSQKYGALVGHLSQLKTFMNEADIVLSCVNSDKYIIEKADVTIRSRPLFIIDIGVPRNVNPDVNSLEAVYLYNIDELKEIAEENRKKFDKEFGMAESILEMQSTEFFNKIKGEL